MSGAANTTTQIAGTRTAASLRREERRGFSILGMSPATHVVLLALACLIWWIARGMVNQTLTVENAAEVHFELDPRVRATWAIVKSPQAVTTSVDLAGPSAEVAAFASSLQANKGVFRYVYVIKPSDIEKFAATQDEQVTLDRELSEFRAEGETLKQAEVRVLEPAAGRVQTVRLERIVVRDAPVLIKDRIIGEIAGFNSNAALQEGFQLEVVGPASRVRETSGEDGRPLLRIVVVELNTLVANRTKTEGKTREQVLQEGFSENLDLLPVEGVSVRRKGTDAPVTQVPVRFTFEALSDYTATPGRDFPVSVVLAQWMIEKGVRVEGVLKQVNVLMLLPRKQLREFNETNVSVVLDLSRIPQDLKNVEVPEGGGPGPRKARLSGQYYSLIVNTERLSPRFLNDKVTVQEYLPAEEIRLVWTE